MKQALESAVMQVSNNCNVNQYYNVIMHLCNKGNDIMLSVFFFVFFHKECICSLCTDWDNSYMQTSTLNGIWIVFFTQTMPEMITKSFSSLSINQERVTAMLRHFFGHANIYQKSIKAEANHHVRQLWFNKTDEFVQSISCLALPLSSKLHVSEFCRKALCPSL